MEGFVAGLTRFLSVSDDFALIVRLQGELGERDGSLQVGSNHLNLKRVLLLDRLEFRDHRRDILAHRPDLEHFIQDQHFKTKSSLKFAFSSSAGGSAPVLRQDPSRDQNGPVLGRTALNTIIASIQREDSGGQELGCAWSAHRHIYIRMGEELVRTRLLYRFFYLGFRPSHAASTPRVIMMEPQIRLRLTPMDLA